MFILNDQIVIHVTNPFAAWVIYRHALPMRCGSCGARQGEACVNMCDRGIARHLPHYTRLNAAGHERTASKVTYICPQYGDLYAS